MFKQSNKKISLFLLFSIVFLCTLCTLNGYATSFALSISNTNSADADSGDLSGNVYISPDASAVGGSKVTFGNPVAVSFPSLQSEISNIQISTGQLSKNTPISPLDFGTNIVWYDGGFGAQSTSDYALYSGVINLTKQIGVTIIRYPGGIPSDSFHWEDAIGPQSQRTDNAVYQSGKHFFQSTFGPDEFGQLLQKTGAVGDITVNFGTGTAEEASDWVQYMTASSKTNYWGKLRAKNGHPTPYDIPYWEVGNEQSSQSKEFYWRSGSVVSINDGGHCASSNKYLCEYVYGGVTKFTDQSGISPSNSIYANGSENQVFYADYPPILAGSQTVYVNGRVWYPVANIHKAYRGEYVYQIDNTTGEIMFGDGLHGSIPPLKATIKISYKSGPHDGFIEYYNLMKAADPSAKICSSYDSVDFIKLMGSSMPYDCLAVHLYGQQVSPDGDPTLFHDILINQSFGFSSELQSQKAAINKYAGDQSKNIVLAVTEYGVNALTSPSGEPNYHRSQDIALFDANLLSILIKNHIPVAEKHYLISFENTSPPGLQTYINSLTFANNALIGGPGSDPVLQPSAYVLQAYSKLLYSNLIQSSIKHNPSVVYSGGTFPALSTVATTDGKGDEAVMVINLSTTNNFLAEIEPSVSNYKKVTAWTIGANNVLAYNTTSDPYAIGLVKRDETIINGKIFANFPAGSISVLQLSH